MGISLTGFISNGASNPDRCRFWSTVIDVFRPLTKLKAALKKAALSIDVMDIIWFINCFVLFSRNFDYLYCVSSLVLLPYA